MKKYQLHTKTPDILKRFPALCKRLEGAERTPVTAGTPRVLCLGADLEKDGACLAVQCGLGEPVNLGTLTRESVLSLLVALRGRGWRCVLGMEACGFGWRFQGQLREAGAEGPDLRHRGAQREAQDQQARCRGPRAAGRRSHRAWQHHDQPHRPRTLAGGTAAPLPEPAPGAGGAGAAPAGGWKGGGGLPQVP